ncbi:alpha/beta hydrolase [Paludisphaera borealis]|uniref:Alpha/beta hydrolase n=1 Tax=Paludisphaera borealis TaxID=1387353 RepID=A0A1U7CL65_9BACT|nr:alpha/beta hydrolase [Paludisphaera borealis]APW59648.1 alpha/beta hydrolase [Paludisphaera borealis]
MPLDPQAQDFLRRLAGAGLPSVSEQTVEQARAQVNLSTRFLGKPPRVHRVEDRTIAGPGGDLAIRVITPEGAGSGPMPIVVFFHGGGWVLGNLDSHENVCRSIANASKSIVAVVDYRLAPEHPFPAAADDAYAALVWLSAHAAEIGGDPSRIAVCGDSAGGNLATVATLMARDRGGPAVAFQALAYPITDFDPDAGSYREFAEGCFLTRSEMLWYWDQYAPNLEDRRRPYVSPNRTDDLSKLPPALVITAGYDVLRDEGEAYARRLAEAGVPVTLSRYDGMIHGFLRRYPFFDQGRAAIEEIAAALREAFGLTAPCSDADGGG